MLLVGMSLFTGWHIVPLLSLAGMLVLTCVSVCLLYRHMDGLRWPYTKMMFPGVMICCLLIWISQYTAGALRLLLPVAGLIFVALIAWRYYRYKRNRLKAWLFVLLCGVVIPVGCMGYNPLACIGMKYSRPAACTGCFFVCGEEGIALRSRWGYIIPPGYNEIEYIGAGTPCFAVRQGKLWGVYNAHEHNIIVPIRYTAILSDGTTSGRSSWVMTAPGDSLPYRFTYSR